jgi:hypothetical protein
MSNPACHHTWRRPIAVLFGCAALLGSLLPAATAGEPVDGYRWTPGLAPEGPVVVVVSLPLQRLYVYRNGVRIGEAAVSTGKPGHETPPGVFTILQKRREHYSNLYDDAPMPYMQRLTWGGIALHEGRVPGYPASHGCIRLPAGFAERLFSVTGTGTVVVVADTQTAPASVTEPGFFAPVDPASGDPRPRPADAVVAWDPARAPQGLQPCVQPDQVSGSITGRVPRPKASHRQRAVARIGLQPGHRQQAEAQSARQPAPQQPMPIRRGVVSAGSRRRCSGAARRHRPVRRGPRKPGSPRRSSRRSATTTSAAPTSMRNAGPADPGIAQHPADRGRTPPTIAPAST